MQAVGVGLTDLGNKRKNNEDYLLIDEALGLYVVCDGVGGNNFGEVASRTAAETIRDFVRENRAIVERYIKERSVAHRAEVGNLIGRAIQAANTRVVANAEAKAELSGMATTAVVLLFAGDNAFLGHVGDSRIYLARQGK